MWRVFVTSRTGCVWVDFRRAPHKGQRRALKMSGDAPTQREQGVQK
jgi:hypothetical protein